MQPREASDLDIQRIARAYCRLMKLDPDEAVAVPAEEGQTVRSLFKPRWELVAKDAVHFVALLRASLGVLT